MNKYQRKNVKERDKLKRELARYMHRCAYLEREKLRLEDEAAISEEVMKANEAYMIYCLQKCGGKSICLDIAEVSTILKKVKECRLGIGVKSENDKSVLAVIEK